jgi:hypothetical protein
VRDRDAGLESSGHDLFAFEDRRQEQGRLPDLPGAAGDFQQQFESGMSGPRFERHLNGLGQQDAGQGREYIRQSRALRLFDSGQFGGVVRAHLLLEPHPDFRRMKAPDSVNPPSRNSPAADKLFQLALVAAELDRKFVERQRLVRHREE